MSAAIGWTRHGRTRQPPTTVFRYQALDVCWTLVPHSPRSPVQDVPRYDTRRPSVRRGGAPSTGTRRLRATRVALDSRFPPAGGVVSLHTFLVHTLCPGSAVSAHELPILAMWWESLGTRRSAKGQSVVTDFRLVRILLGRPSSAETLVINSYFK